MINLNTFKLMILKVTPSSSFLPAGSCWSLFSDDASDSVLVSGLEAELHLEWKRSFLEKNW